MGTATKAGTKQRAEYERLKKWRKENREKYLANRRRYHADNRDKENGRCKKYRETHKEAMCDYFKRYAKTLKGCVAHLMAGIRTRCMNPNNKAYARYGSRGIKLCFTTQELLSWLEINHVNPRGLEIHRIDNNDDYTLDNIIFLTKSEHSSIHNPKGTQIASSARWPSHCH